mmetsp:Transcript_1226/g.2905  ORF Transcript_1226/g.2905 Transcript_1226/m.2905 type:complete len:184 (+) Transcript_1226:64-615(+)|eukprot:CAMPEP_0197896932 /NCGR_PEP_ID=MMETSP1439-20131203/41209_1 /TAXON_ID=66791 /ORGANISM="Gonyaulax spinifera, Strain CCMP409" /LENGTH=183 /DNA_ID=CAMNT_0043517519 /DNA_START=60 /DNA_END=611 /DNA_ORIENTATION=-
MVVRSAGRALGAVFAVQSFPVAAHMFVYKKCETHTCNSPDFPLLDWNPQTRECHCAAHPCHNDVSEDGSEKTMHSCDDKAKPYLSFMYTTEKKLVCGCQEKPTAGSIYLAKELCAGHHCEDPSYLLDYDETEGKCVCNLHPCLDDEGMKHECPDDGTFHLLKFHYDEGGKLACECTANYKSEL